MRPHTRCSSIFYNCFMTDHSEYDDEYVCICAPNRRSKWQQNESSWAVITPRLGRRVSDNRLKHVRFMLVLLRFRIVAHAILFALINYCYSARGLFECTIITVNTRLRYWFDIYLFVAVSRPSHSIFLRFFFIVHMITQSNLKCVML